MVADNNIIYTARMLEMFPLFAAHGASCEVCKNVAKGFPNNQE